MTDTSAELLQQGIAALKAGNKDDASRLIQAALRANPANEQAWIWLSGVLTDPAKQRDCLERALAINPANEVARRGLQQLSGPPAGPVAAPPGAPRAGPSPGAPRMRSLDQMSEDERLAAAGIGIDPRLLRSSDFVDANAFTSVPAHARLPDPVVGECFFCTTPDVAEFCPSCTRPQSYDCPSCGLPIELRASLSCKCGESMRPYLRQPEGIDHEKLGNRYQAQGYLAAAIKQWELAIGQTDRPAPLHRRLATAYLDLGMADRARVHYEATRQK